MDLYININLQLFAEEKTESATPKRIREAREKGQVAKSREIVTALMLIISFVVMKVLALSMYNDIKSIFNKFLTLNIELDEFLKVNEVMRIYIYCLIMIAKIIGPVVLITGFIAILANYIQVGYIFTLKPLAPKFNKLNPIEGFKRIFSVNSLVELLKSILKICVIGYILYVSFRKNYKYIPQLIGTSMEESIKFICTTIYNTAILIGVILLILSIIDYFYQKWQYEKNLKMSKQEIKEEFKQTEGNPQIKSKIREKQRQMALRRMIAEIPKADVIITNPTHFAIAVKYDANTSEAPIVIGKGKDLIAQKIKETAKQNGVPIVENKPLAQALYKSVEIGNQIPVELYKAVAEVLAFVYNLKK